MNFSAKLRLYFHICKSFLEKVTEKVVDSHVLQIAAIVTSYFSLLFYIFRIFFLLNNQILSALMSSSTPQSFDIL